MDAPETVGEDILKLYIALNVDYRYNRGLDTEQKRALRLCSKRLKKAIDDTITHIFVSDDDQLQAILQQNSWNLRSLGILGNAFQQRSAASMRSLLDSACNKFPALEVLEIKNWNTFAGLPESIGELSSLKCLAVPVPPSGLPYSITQLTRLEKLFLDDFSAHPIGLQLHGITRIQHLRSLKELDLKFNKPTRRCTRVEMPQCIFNLTTLEILRFEGNIQMSVPEAIQNLKNLGSLVINVVKMDTLPESITNLSHLTDLQLTCPRGLERLPHSLGYLTALRRLRLGFCEELQALPASLGNFKHLSSLEIRHCYSLQNIPGALGDLRSLKQLAITDCSGLTVLPESITRIINSLNRLYLYNCPFLSTAPGLLGVFQDQLP